MCIYFFILGRAALVGLVELEKSSFLPYQSKQEAFDIAQNANSMKDTCQMLA